MKATPTNQTVDDYIKQLPDDRRAAIETVHRLILKTLPGIETKMWGKIIGYGNYHYKSKSGREGDWFPVGLTSGAAYMSLYICAIKDGKYLAEANKDRLGKVSVGKSCIRFRKLEDLDLDVARELVKDAPEYLLNG